MLFFFPLCIFWQGSSINYQFVVSWHEVHLSLACVVVSDLDSNLSPLSWKDVGWTLQKREAFLPTSSVLNFFLLHCSCHGLPSGTHPPASFVASLSLSFPAPHPSIWGPALSRGLFISSPESSETHPWGGDPPSKSIPSLVLSFIPRTLFGVLFHPFFVLLPVAKSPCSTFLVQNTSVVFVSWRHSDTETFKYLEDIEKPEASKSGS